MRAAFGAVLAATVLTAGCGSDRIPADTAHALLADSRAVEARLAAGDRCGADRRAQALVTKAKVAIQAGLVPISLAGELRTRTMRLAAALNCPPPAPAPAQSQLPSAVGDEGDENGDEGGGKGGHGKKRGHEK